MEESLFAVPLRPAISFLLLQLGLINVEHCFSAMDPGVGWISRISKWVFFLPILIWSICMVKREPEIWTSNCFAQLLLCLIRPIMVCGWTKCLSKKLVQPMQWSVWPLTTTLCCGQRSLQWTKMWTKAYFTRLSNSALPLVSSLALTWLVLYLYNAFTFPLLHSKFTSLVNTSTFLFAFGQFISSAFFGQTQNMSCCLLPNCTPKITADFDSGSKTELHLIYIFLVNKVSLKEQMLLTNSYKPPGICILFVDLLSKKISMLLS